MDRFKRIRERLLAFALCLVPHNLLYYAQLLRQVPTDNPVVDARLEQLLQRYTPDPHNPLRDAVDNRLSLFGPRR